MRTFALSAAANEVPDGVQDKADEERKFARLERAASTAAILSLPHVPKR